MEFITGWTVLPSTIDGPAMAREALRVNESAPIDGVLCWDEGRILAASQVAAALGLPGGDPATIWRLRDKAQTRARLATSRVPQPRSVAVKTLPEALAAADRVGYPAILKPRGLGASLGVVRVDDPTELRANFAFTRDTLAPDPVVYASDQPVLVEEFVSGAEVSIDSVVVHGTVTPLFLARKVTGYPPYAEEVGHYVDAADPLLADPVFTSVVQETHSALGFRDGWTHTEYMITADGPVLIEVNGRLGGDLIPYLGMLATGVDPGLVAAAAACGRAVTSRPTRRRVAGIRFFYVDRDDTTIDAISFRASELPATIDRAITVARPGATVSPPPKGTVWGRIAYATAIADTIATCGAALDAAEAALQVVSRDADTAPGSARRAAEAG
jgi:biotin carboxylase